MSQEIGVDNIVQEIEGNDEKQKQLAEFWSRIDILTNGTTPDFHPSSLDALMAKKDLPVDQSYLGEKQIRAVLTKTDPQTLLKALRKNCKHEDPDTLLVRFLRARSWRTNDSFVMLLKTLVWRADERIEDGLLAGGDAAQKYPDEMLGSHEKKVCKETVAMISSGESFIHGRDKEGNPLVFVRVKLHNQWAQGKEAFMRASIMEVESIRMLLRAPITSVSLVFDMTGFGLKNMDMNALKVMASGLQDNYPECLGQVYVYNAPWIVDKIWLAVQSWLDPVVASKVLFLSNIEKLAEYVPMETIPSYMGGKDPYEYKWIDPVPPAALTAEQIAERDALTAEREKMLDAYVQAGPAWAYALLKNDPSWTAKRSEARHVALQLQENYWKLDKYTRGRVMLDRAGILGPNGEVNL